ncbi:MAG: hypothetical protein PSV35_02025 [bacterium]|nr:hypothetical protein [bacterium]
MPQSLAPTQPIFLELLAQVCSSSPSKMIDLMSDEVTSPNANSEDAVPTNQSATKSMETRNKRKGDKSTANQEPSRSLLSEESAPKRQCLTIKNATLFKRTNSSPQKLSASRFFNLPSPNNDPASDPLEIKRKLRPLKKPLFNAITLCFKWQLITLILPI